MPRPKQTLQCLIRYAESRAISLALLFAIGNASRKMQPAAMFKETLFGGCAGELGFRLTAGLLVIGWGSSRCVHPAEDAIAAPDEDLSASEDAQ